MRSRLPTRRRSAAPVPPWPAPTPYTWPSCLPQGGTNLYTMILNGGGTGTVEVHGLSQQSHYSQFFSHFPTLFAPASPSEWQFFTGQLHGDGRPDLYGVHFANTGSGQVEVHVLSAASNYQQWILHTATPMSASGLTRSNVQFVPGSLFGDQRPNIYAILLSGTGSGNVEIHALSDASSYNSWALHSTTAFSTGSVSAANWQFRIGDRGGSGDLIAIVHGGTSSGKTEVHVLARTSGYQALRSTLRPLSAPPWTPTSPTPSATMTTTATPIFTSSRCETPALARPRSTCSPARSTMAPGSSTPPPASRRRTLTAGNSQPADLMSLRAGAAASVDVLGGSSNYTTWIEPAASGLGPTAPASWQFSTHLQRRGPAGTCLCHRRYRVVTRPSRT